ncbi:MAG: hypothetical protein MUD01_08980, partial [Chloroflexaceae bacterium]|nr:hypothetical protein [Chloroflexaceae bacterium]
YSFVITNSDLHSGTLNRPGRVRADRIYTLEQTLAVRVFGQVQSSVLARIQHLLNDLTAVP